MALRDKKSRFEGLPAGVLLASTVGLLALPSAVLAFSSRFEARYLEAAADSNESYQPPKLADGTNGKIPMPVLSKHGQFRFTPAGSANRPGRSVTVAVRVDPQWSQTILVRGTAPRRSINNPEASPVQIAPMAFNLGVSRGYHSFAEKLVPAGKVKSIDLPVAPSFADNGISNRNRDEPPSRFNPKIVLDQKLATGRAPRTFSLSEERVDVGGSYRVTRNLDVTAGIRYSQDRDRLQPLTDRKKDNQAVYVGTQFRF
jgi:hypothetical protein